MFRFIFTISFLFFFSSRRRHTRSLCDWSSDVCSSDLEKIGRIQMHLNSPDFFIVNGTVTPLSQVKIRSELAIDPLEQVRSEERRVGKECRSRGSPDH